MAIEREAPTRTLSKEQAARHLIHAAVRMIGTREDPFATHMLIQSADKLLIDMSQKLGKPLAFSWSENVKPEYVKELMTILREAYNFFKHADKDHDQRLGVANIALLNVLELTMCVVNFKTVFGYSTDHMRLIHSFASLIAPNSFVEPANREDFDKLTRDFRSATPAEFFHEISTDPMCKASFPNLENEKLDDLQDTSEFYDATISELSSR